MNKENKGRILLLGGEGFIGRNLALYFAPTYDCFSCGDKKSLFSERQDIFISGNPYKDTLNYRVDVIIHLIDNKECSAESFLEEEKRLIENISLDSDIHLIIFSSAVLYANPDSEYGMRKKRLEDFYVQYCREHGIPLTIIRLFNTFGSFQIPYRQGSLVANLIYDHLLSIPTEIQDLSAKRDFLYAGDIPKFVELFIKEKITGTYDLGRGKLTSLREVIAMLEEQMEGEVLKIINRNNSESLTIQPADNPFLSRVNLTPMSQAVLETINFFRNNRAIVQTYVAKK